MRTILHCLLAAISFYTSVSAQSVSSELVEKADDLILSSRFTEALELLEQSAGGSSSLLVANKKAEALTRVGDFQGAEAILNDIEAQLVLKPDALLKAVTDSNLGFLQLYRGRHDLAEESLHSALDTFEKESTTDNREVARTLSFLGLVYMSQGKYAQAQEQLHRALSIRQSLDRNREALVAATYNDLGLAYSQTDKDRALDYYEQAHKMYLSLYGENDPRIAISNINTGIIYRDLELFGDAINNFENALRIWNSVYTQPHPARAIALYNLGQTYLRLNDQKAAGEYYRQALKMYRESYGPKHPEISSVLNAMGNLSVAQGNFDEALTYYQDALKANMPDFNNSDISVNPALKDYYNGTGLLHTLLFKAQAFEARYTQRSLRFSDLREALNVLAYCDSLIDQLRHHSTNESDKLLLGVMASEVYSDGVRIAYQAGLNALRKDHYFGKAFYFAEKSKGAVLLESISDANAKSFAGIPPALLDEEKNLRSALSITARKLAEKPAEEEEKRLRESAFDLKRQYDTFIERLEQQYPEYFDLKFNVETPSIAELQALLPGETALISYFIDEKNGQLYIFMLRRDQYKVWQKPLIAGFDKYITGLRNGIYFQEINTYKMSAYQLGRLLIPRIPSSVRDLVILPAGRLGLVPFETLLTDDPGTSTDYASLPYLINRYSVRYEFSAGLLAQKTEKKGPPAGTSIFLCAPVSFPHKPYLGELPGTEKEIAEISKLFADKSLKTAVVTREDAQEKRIKGGALKDFKYVHFATHGVVDELQPELSRIFLLADASDDGDLFAGEIYSMELDANLVTLSACQTGLGKLLKGEGVIGLSRALVYAGARNIVVSFWNVADESTAILMRDFYKNLLETGNPGFGQALRQSKLQLMSDKRFASPFYWAPFVLIGF